MTIQNSAVQRLAECNIRKWLQAKETTQRLENNNDSSFSGPYLALARESGACGSEVARKVAERLGWDVLDSEIVDYMEEHYGTSRCLIQRFDERHESWLASVIASQFNRDSISEATFNHRVAKLFLLAAARGNVVFVGRGARFILPRNNGLSVRIVAPLEFRIEQIMQRQEMDEKEARRFIMETDRTRDAYIKDHFNQVASDPHHYDLVVNVGEITLDEATDTIVELIEHRLCKAA